MGIEPEKRSEEDMASLEAALGSSLRRSLKPPAAEPPARLDDSIKVMARSRAGEVRAALNVRRRRTWPVWTAAAVLVVAVGLWTGLAIGRGGQSTGYFDGRVKADIVDAYRLSRWLKSGEKPEANWDYNGDGRADQADVEVLVSNAVSVSEETR